jgi:uncharacterized protein YutE (UPF0331/DUF86 family)
MPRNSAVPRDVLVRRLAFLRRLLHDLAAFEHATPDEVAAHHYTLERIFELLVGAASDLLFHVLSEQGITASSYRDSFRLEAEHGLLPADLAGRLQQAAGMRNILVHMYEEIDHTILHQSIGAVLRDFAQFVALAEQWGEASDAS